jgi:hypothetical protein
MVSCLVLVGSLISSQPAADPPLMPEVARSVAVAGEGYFPVMIRLGDGRLAAVLRGGATHLGKTGRLDWIESTDAGATWTAPRTVVDGPWDDRNPALGQFPNGSICLAYAECTCYNEQGEWSPSSGGFSFYTVVSDDAGRTWTPRQPLETPFAGGGSPYGRIVVTPDGLGLMSVYGAVDAVNASLFPEGREGATDAVGFLISRDNGRTWGEFHAIAKGFNETALLAVTSDRLLAFARSDDDQHLALFRSEDGGDTWSGPVALGLGSQHPGDAALLPGGDVLVVHGSRLAPYGVHAFRSAVDGDMENAGRVALANDSESTDQGYPSVVVLSDGSAVVLYYAVGTATNPGQPQAVSLRFDPSLLPGGCVPVEDTVIETEGEDVIPVDAGDRFPWTTRDIPNQDEIN